MPKHFFFDLDNTLTPSKSLILSEHIPVFKRLAQVADIIVVSGHGEKDIRKHLTESLVGTYHILGQNGNYAETKDGTILWERHLSIAQKAATIKFIEKAIAHLQLQVRDENDIIEDRDSQISYSLIGHHELFETKTAFDPTHEKRHKLLSDLAEDVEELRRAGIEIRSGGTTVLDFFEFGKNKGFNVAAFIEAMGWNRSECLYFGDALFQGGNDETVIGVIETRKVDGPEQTFSFISSMLS